jgi:hypothetical protein
VLLAAMIGLRLKGHISALLALGVGIYHMSMMHLAALYDPWRWVWFVSDLLDRLSCNFYVPADSPRRQVWPVAGMPGRGNRGQPPSTAVDRFYLRGFL